MVTNVGYAASVDNICYGLREDADILDDINAFAAAVSKLLLSVCPRWKRMAVLSAADAPTEVCSCNPGLL